MINRRDSGTKSPWQVSADRFKQPSKAEDTIYDVVIIGAGITGITTALKLQQAGKKCLILEGHNLGFGTTGGTTAHINTFFDATYPEIDSDFGEEASLLVAKAGQEALDTISTLVREYQIDCDLETKTGYLFSETDKESKQLEDILLSAKKAGVSVKHTGQNGVPIPFQQVLEFPNQAQFHPLKYINALAAQYTALGGALLENEFVRELSNEDGIHIAITDKQQFKALNVVYATHVPPGVNHFSFRCAPYRSYVLGLKLKDEQQYPVALAYDMQEPYHYLRTHEIKGEKLLILGGADHKTGHGQPSQSYRDLEDYARQYFDIEKVAYRWSSQYYVPVDGLPYIGPMSNSEDTLFVATGFNGNGMTWGTIAGLLLTDLILGNENPYATLLKPYRMKPIAGFSEFVKENADVAYHFIADRFRGKHLESLAELESGDGMVIDLDGKKIAVYRDSSGMVAALDPTCTHAGCTVCFNAAEKSWDCPCHGGRFDLSGRVLAGPPRKDLTPVHFSNTQYDQ